MIDKEAEIVSNKVLIFLALIDAILLGVLFVSYFYKGVE